MFKKSLCLSALVLSNTVFGYNMPSVKSVSDFVSKNINTPQAKKVAVLVACFVGAICVQKKNERWVARQKEYAALEEACKTAEKNRKIAEAKKVIDEAYDCVERLNTFAKTSLQDDLVAYAHRSNYPLAVRDAYKGYIVEVCTLSNKLLEAKQVLLSESGEHVAIDGYVAALVMCENLLRGKLEELSNSAFFQEALEKEQAQESLILEKQRIDAKRLAEKKQQRGSSFKKQGFKGVKKTVAQVEKTSSNNGYNSSFDRLCGLCDQAYNG